MSLPFSTKSGPSTLRLLVAASLAFFYIYKVSFVFAPPITTARVALAVNVILLAVGRYKILVKTPAYLLFLLLPLVVAQYLVVGEPTNLSRFGNLFMLSVMGSILLAALVRDFDLALRALLYAITAQAIIILAVFPSLTLRLLIQKYVVISSAFEFEQLYRGFGLSSVAGAHLSLVQSLGVLSGWFALRRNINKTGQRDGGGWIICSMVLCALSSTLAGRTGMLVSVAFFGLAWLDGCFSRRGVGLSLLGLVGLIVLFDTVLEALMPQGYSVDRMSYRIFSVFLGEDRTIGGLMAMNVPGLGLETIVGTGLVLAPSGANAAGHDAGVIQSYFSLGLIFTLFFYGLYAYVLTRMFEFKSVFFCLVLVAAFLVVEFKEPFLFKQSCFFALHFLFMTYQYEIKNKKLESLVPVI